MNLPSPSPGPLHLEVIAGNAVGTTIVVADELIIGRQESGPGRLADDIEISRQHARVSREQAGVYAIEDLGSTNGTFVNGLRISGPGVLSVGDTIEVGGTTVVVRPAPAQEPVAPSPAPPPAPLATEPLDMPSGVEEDMLAAQEAGPAQAPISEPAADAPVAAPPAPEADADPAPIAADVAEPPLAALLTELRLEIDFESREARLALGDGSGTLRLAYDDGRWRLEPPGE